MGDRPVIAREHTGEGWGNPTDPAQAEIWLCDGYVCAYDPRSPGLVELFTQFGRTDAGFARTNDAAQHIAYGELQARGEYKRASELLGCDQIGSRFD
ncbi:MAG: hypothetical protein ACTHMO_03910 [Rhodanobacteraceae bacterium]